MFPTIVTRVSCLSPFAFGTIPCPGFAPSSVSQYMGFLLYERVFGARRRGVFVCQSKRERGARTSEKRVPLSPRQECAPALCH